MNFLFLHNNLNLFEGLGNDQYSNIKTTLCKSPNYPGLLYHINSPFLDGFLEPSNLEAMGVSKDTFYLIQGKNLVLSCFDYIFSFDYPFSLKTTLLISGGLIFFYSSYKTYCFVLEIYYNTLEPLTEVFNNVLFLIRAPFLGTRTFYNSIIGVELNLNNLFNQTSLYAIYNRVQSFQNRTINLMCDYIFGPVNLEETLPELTERYNIDQTFVEQLRNNNFQEIVRPGLESNTNLVNNMPLASAARTSPEVPMFHLERLNGVPQFIPTDTPSRAFRNLIPPEDSFTVLGQAQWDNFNYPNLLFNYLNRLRQDATTTTLGANPQTPVINAIQTIATQNNALSFQETALNRTADRYGIVIFNRWVREIDEREIDIVNSPEHIAEFFRIFSDSGNMF